jgi:hypothetical protein
MGGEGPVKSMGGRKLQGRGLKSGRLAAAVCRQGIKLLRVPKSVMKGAGFCVDFQLS